MAGLAWHGTSKYHSTHVIFQTIGYLKPGGGGGGTPYNGLYLELCLKWVPFSHFRYNYERVGISQVEV